MKTLVSAVIIAIAAFAASGPCRAADDSDDENCVSVRDIYKDALKDKSEIIKLKEPQIVRALVGYGAKYKYNDVPPHKEVIVVIPANEHEMEDAYQKQEEHSPLESPPDGETVYFIEKGKSCKSVQMYDIFLFYKGTVTYGKPV